MSLQSFVLKIKRAETPFFRLLKRTYKFFMTAGLPIPRPLKPLGAALFEFHYLFLLTIERFVTFFYREPLFRSRCEHVGDRLSIGRLPQIMGHAVIRIGDDVKFNGATGIFSGRVFDQPKITIGNRVSLGHQFTISCNLSITIEDDVLIAGNVYIADHDGHPVDPVLRAAGYPAPTETVRPVLIRRNAWVGAGCYILKGVTIGEAAIVGSGSVVTKDIPDYAIAAGNPARVIKILDSGASSETAIQMANTQPSA